MKREITAKDWRIKPDSYNSWALCKPLFHKDESPRLDKDGNHYYEPFRWYTSLNKALDAWFDMLMADELIGKASDVDDLINALDRVRDKVTELPVSA